MSEKRNPREKLRPLGHRGLALPKQETVNRALGLNKPKPKPDPARQAFADLTLGNILRSMCHPRDTPEERGKDDFDNLIKLPRLEDVEHVMSQIKLGIVPTKSKRRR